MILKVAYLFFSIFLVCKEWHLALVLSKDQFQ